MKPEVLITQNPNSALPSEPIQSEMQESNPTVSHEDPLLNHNFWAKLFKTFQPIYGDTEQASLAVAERILNRKTDSTIEDMPPEELITRAIQAFEYVEPFKNTEAGKPLFNRVLRMLAGSSDNASMPAYWSPEAVNQFAEYYKDSKYQDYKFTFVSLAPDSIRFIDVTSKELPDLLSEDDLSWLPRAIESLEGQSMYLADYTPEFTDENVKRNAPTPISPKMWRSIWAKLFETDQLIYDDTEQASLATAKRVLDRETDSTIEDMPPETLITRAIQAFEYVEPFQHTEAGKPLFHRVLSMLAGNDNNASLYACWSQEAINQFSEYYKASEYSDYKFTFAARTPNSVSFIPVTGKELPDLLGEDDLSWLPAGVTFLPEEVLYTADYLPCFLDQEACPKSYNTISTNLLDSSSMPIRNISSPMLDKCNLLQAGADIGSFGISVYGDIVVMPNSYPSWAEEGHGIQIAKISSTNGSLVWTRTFTAGHAQILARSSSDDIMAMDNADSFGAGQDVSSAARLNNNLGTYALLAVGTAYLAKKCGLFRHDVMPAAAMAPQAMELPTDNQPQNNIGPTPRT